MKTIVAVDEKWGIGKNNGLLFAIPEDMRFFRETTLNKVVVMGSNTLKKFPGRQTPEKPRQYRALAGRGRARRRRHREKS